MSEVTKQYIGLKAIANRLAGGSPKKLELLRRKYNLPLMVIPYRGQLGWRYMIDEPMIERWQAGVAEFAATTWRERRRQQRERHRIRERSHTTPLSDSSNKESST